MYVTINMYEMYRNQNIVRFFFFAQTLLSSITLGKRFRTKFTYDYNLCIIHALNIISIATHHQRLNFEFLVGCLGTNSTRFPLFATLTKPNPLFLAR